MPDRCEPSGSLGSHPIASSSLRRLNLMMARPSDPDDDPSSAPTSTASSIRSSAGGRVRPGRGSPPRRDGPGAASVRDVIADLPRTAAPDLSSGSCSGSMSRLARPGRGALVRRYAPWFASGWHGRRRIVLVLAVAPMPATDVRGSPSRGPAARDRYGRLAEAGLRGRPDATSRGPSQPGPPIRAIPGPRRPSPEVRQVPRVQPGARLPRRVAVPPG